jgi:UDP-N-acetylmuramate dehydrogenase
VTAAAGEVWDDFIGTTIAKGLFGLENLSAIPGTVGATPVQNIGAYGSDASDFIESVRVLDLKTLEFRDLSNKDCLFAYRDSLFKHEKGRYVVISVVFNLHNVPKINASYKDIAEYFEKNKITDPSPLQVRQAVMEIRMGKLPDWKLWGTAGSFFKNPIITEEQFVDLKKRYPGLPGFPEPDSMMKISLAWILDKVCNLKGMTIGNVHIYEKQALVVVATPGATSKEVLELTQKIQSIVKEKVGLVIEAEVEWVN